VLAASCTAPGLPRPWASAPQPAWSAGEHMNEPTNEATPGTQRRAHYVPPHTQPHSTHPTAAHLPPYARQLCLA
jgi:hypothetical protein